MLRVCLCLLAVAAVVPACGSDDASRSIDPSEVATIVVRFNDSSVPPQFHRSWAVTATGGSYEASVDSYGTEATGTGSIDDATIATFLVALGELGSPPGDDVACTGGTSYFFDVLDAAGSSIYRTSTPLGCGDDARSWNTQAGSVASIVSSAIDLGPLYAEVDALVDE